MGQPRFVFESFDVKGVEISLKKIDYKELSRNLLPTYVATLDDEDVELRREQTLAFKYYDQKGNDVTERKAEFQWWRVDAEDGQRTPASKKRSETISVVKKIPYSVLEKNLIPKNFYLLYARRKKDDSPKAYALRVQQLREEAERFVAEGVAGIGSFTWGL